MEAKYKDPAPARETPAAPGEAVLIPFKGDGSKLRLSAALTPEHRRRLALTMLADVRAAAAAWPIRLLVTSDAEAADQAARAGWCIVDDPGEGLNAAVAVGTARAASLGARALLVLPFDVPLVSAADLRAMFACDAAVVVAPCRDGGTGGLLRRPPEVIGSSFGPGSAAAHLAAAAAADLAVRRLDLGGLALDVDDGDDLRRLAAAPDGPEGAASVRLARQLLDS